MRLLAEVGLHLAHGEAVAIFADRGFKIDGQQVFLSERQVMDAIAQC